MSPKSLKALEGVGSFFQAFKITKLHFGQHILLFSFFHSFISALPISKVLLKLSLEESFLLKESLLVTIL